MNVPAIGSRMFSSMNQNIVSSPKDDIESIGYLLLYLIHGHLPWSLSKDNKID